MFAVAYKCFYIYRHVIQFNSKIPSVSTQYDILSDIMFNNNNTTNNNSGDESEGNRVISKLARNFNKLSKELNVPQRLTEVGITSNDINQLAHEAMKQTRLLPNNPREVTLEDAMKIYNDAI